MKKKYIIAITLIIAVSCAKKSKPNLNSLSSKNVAIIFQGTVNLRSGPGLKHRVKRQVGKGTKLEILSKATAKEKIGRFTDSWYNVRLANGDIGFIFGAFLFEVDALFEDKYWNFLTYSEYAFGVKFKRNGNYIFVYADKNSYRKSISTFKIEKDYIKLKTREKGELIPGKLYFFRYKGENYLTKQDLPLDTKFDKVIKKNMTLWSNDYKGMKKFIESVKKEREK